MFFKSPWVGTLLNAVVAHWLDGKCQWLLATELKVQHCWTLKTAVGNRWRQSPTCAGDSRQLKYKHMRDCRRAARLSATVGDWSVNQAIWCWTTWSILFLINGLAPKPLPKPILTHCQFDPHEQTSEIWIKLQTFSFNKIHLKCFLQNDNHFVHAPFWHACIGIHMSDLCLPTSTAIIYISSLLTRINLRKTYSISDEIGTWFCFALFCCGNSHGLMSYFCSPISFRVASLALGQSYDCPSASEVILKDMGKIIQQQTITECTKVWTIWVHYYTPRNEV